VVLHHCGYEEKEYLRDEDRDVVELPRTLEHGAIIHEGRGMLNGDCKASTVWLFFQFD
jgi:hypothetical protein